MSCWRSMAADRKQYRTALNDVVKGIGGCERVRRSVIADQALINWEGWNDPDIAAGSTVPWKLLVDGERRRGIPAPPGA